MTLAVPAALTFSDSDVSTAEQRGLDVLGFPCAPLHAIVTEFPHVLKLILKLHPELALNTHFEGLFTSLARGCKQEADSEEGLAAPQDSNEAVGNPHPVQQRRISPQVFSLPVPLPLHYPVLAPSQCNSYSFGRLSFIAARPSTLQHTQSNPEPGTYCTYLH